MNSLKILSLIEVLDHLTPEEEQWFLRYIEERKYDKIEVFLTGWCDEYSLNMTKSASNKKVGVERLVRSIILDYIAERMPGHSLENMIFSIKYYDDHGHFYYDRTCQRMSIDAVTFDKLVIPDVNDSYILYIEDCNNSSRRYTTLTLIISKFEDIDNQ